MAFTTAVASRVVLLTALLAAHVAAYRDIGEAHGALAAAMQNGSEEPGTLPATLPAEKQNVSEDPETLPAAAAAESHGIPKADALRELLDENNGPVAASMKAADESAATLLDSAKQWKIAGEDIKKEFEESVKKQVLETGKTLEEEHGGVKEEADEKPKKVLEELKQKHTASAPGGSGDSSSHTEP